MKILKFMFFVILIIAIPAMLHATCIVQAEWTPSPNAASESLMLDGAEQNCPNAGNCEFVVPELDEQKIVIRSYNAQGNHVDSDPYILQKEALPTRAVIIRVITTCTQQ